MRILGLDPGFATTGFAVLELSEREKKLLTVGVIKTPPGLDFSARLEELDQDLRSLLMKYKPNYASIEQIFFSKNVSTGIQVAEARGVILLALHQNGVKVEEFSPSAMKRALTGDGKADKQAIQKMVSLELGLKALPKPDDAADALSLALTLAHQLR